jgi:flagellar protein FliT
MDRKAILAVYDKVSGVMGLMVQAAEANDWDMVTELEPQCTAYVDALRASDNHDGLTEDEMQYKMSIIQKILDDDRRIRELLQPWMKELSDLICSSANSRRINRIYGTNMAS